MRRYLIDTHTFLWFCEGSSQLSPTAKLLIENSDHQIYLSVASLWEIAIKNSIGKLAIAGGYETVLNDLIQNDINILGINFNYTLIQNKLPWHHRDPFDRMIISQAIGENMGIISREELFDIYLAGSGAIRFW
jgi:PIN domain nuclease of toxin-antitoxin system